MATHIPQPVDLEQEVASKYRVRLHGFRLKKTDYYICPPEIVDF